MVIASDCLAEVTLATRITTKTTVQTETFTKRQAGRTPLTREEELVVRMTRGLSEGPECELQQQGQDHEEARASMALMEASLLAQMHGEGPLAEQAGVEIDHDLKARILEQLSKMES